LWEKFSAEEHEMALKNSVSIVGPPLEPPTDEQEYYRVFAALAQEGAEGLLVSDAENFTNRRLVVELAAKDRLPTIYPYRQYVEAGGLMSYGIDLSDVGYRVADLADNTQSRETGRHPISNRPTST
jgi:putative ABC transport system substrate-binding protein